MAPAPKTPLGKVQTRFGYNIARVRNLLRVAAEGTGITDARVDIVRSAVVMLHATLEDVLRGLLAWKLPLAQAEHMKEVSFDRERRKEKITVAELAAHRGRTIDEYLNELIAIHLERETFNNRHDVLKALSKLGFNTDTFAALLPVLEPPMKRRHKIVHESDRNPANEHGHGTPRKIDAGEVGRWVDDVEEFIDAVLRRLQSKEPVAGRLARKRLDRAK